MQAKEMVQGMFAMQVNKKPCQSTAINCARYAVNQIIHSSPEMPIITYTYEDGSEEITPAIGYWLRVQEILNDM